MRYLQILLAAAASVGSAAEPSVIANVTVYRQTGRYGGWPANHGIWSWGNEILVGFEAGYFSNNEKGHAIDYTRPEEHLLARSLDGGETWKIEKPESLKAPPGSKMASVPVEQGGKTPEPCPGGIDFTNPNFALTARMENVHTGPSRFYYSYDRGKTWKGPYRIPDFGQKGIAARTDYLVNGKRDCTLFMAARSRMGGKDGRSAFVPPMAARRLSFSRLSGRNRMTMASCHPPFACQGRRS